MFGLYTWIAAQVITESLPISSSSHLKIVETILQMHGCSDFLLQLPPHFDDLIHVPTLCILFLFFYQRLSIFFYNPWPTRILLCASIVRTGAACAITVAMYAIFNYFSVYAYFPLPIGLVVSICLLASLYRCPEKNESYTFSKALLLGFVQGCALLPGISRLGSTYVIARWLGITSRDALEISFVIQVPLILAASVRALGYALKSAYFYQLLNMRMCLVILIASVISYGALWLVSYGARKNMLWICAVYLMLPLGVWLYLHA